jgi:hypothetical protein
MIIKIPSPIILALQIKLKIEGGYFLLWIVVGIYTYLKIYMKP